MKIELGGTAVGTGYDQLQVNGVVALGKAKLAASLINGFDPSGTVAQKFVNRQQQRQRRHGQRHIRRPRRGGAAHRWEPALHHHLQGRRRQRCGHHQRRREDHWHRRHRPHHRRPGSGRAAPGYRAGRHHQRPAGDDTIDARGGNDIVNGGEGRDTLAGGLGFDAFIFDAKLKKSNADHVTQFLPSTDEIRLDLDIFTKLKLGELPKKAFFAKKNADEAKDSKDRIVVDTKSGECWYDKDGKGGAKAKLFAILDGSPDDISHSDFVVVA